MSFSLVNVICSNHFFKCVGYYLYLIYLCIYVYIYILSPLDFLSLKNCSNLSMYSC